MGKPLKNPPVYFTVAQVRFNPILKLSEFLDSIQDAFRRSGFPDYKPQKMIVLQVNIQNGQPMPIPVTVDRFTFQDLKKTHSFLLESDKLTLQSTDYGRFEAFSQRFLEGLSLLHGIVKLDFIDRVGLRYLDRVMPRESYLLNKYLSAGVVGLSDTLGGKALHSFSETLVEVDDIKILSRVVTQIGPVGFPPDLVPQDMAIDSRFNSYNGMHAVLDNDGFFEGREVVSLDSIRNHLDKIHEVINSAFKATVTRFALDQWDL